MAWVFRATGPRSPGAAGQGVKARPGEYVEFAGWMASKHYWR